MVTTPLRERMRQALRIRNMSPRTERIYLDSVARFALYFHLSPDRLGLPQIEQYLFYLRDEKKVSYCWFNQCVCALRFFYLYVLDRPELVLRITHRPPRAPPSSRAFRGGTARLPGRHRFVP